MAITFTHKGSLAKSKKFLQRLSQGQEFSNIERFAREGVDALSSATPIESGETAVSWSYEIERSGNGVSIYWRNSNVNDGVVIAVILQYGHGTRNGGYVQGRDYINPAMRPIFDQIAENVWREVTRS